jgi:hypothetical protein
VNIIINGGTTESLSRAIAADLSGFGGILRCSTCHGVQDAGDIARNLREGWPACCGYTMTWVTQRQLDEEASR